MKKRIYILMTMFICLCIVGCHKIPDVQIVASTAPVYEFASRICDGTDIKIGRLITENVSCLHDYTLQTSQMRMLENAQIVILSGAGLEDFLLNAIPTHSVIVDSSKSVELLCSPTTHDHKHEHGEHSRSNDYDAHIWLSPGNARKMSNNIYSALKTKYPQYEDVFTSNLHSLLERITALEEYGTTQLSAISSRNIITFHDGFTYLADAFDLKIIHAIEEESGSEASAEELIKICALIDSYKLNAVFTEKNGSVSAAGIIAAEKNIPIHQLDMAMSNLGYFEAMYYNIDTLKEALR